MTHDQEDITLNHRGGMLHHIIGSEVSRDVESRKPYFSMWGVVIRMLKELQRNGQSLSALFITLCLGDL